jgi:PAS domain S-box-containing protein
MTADGGEAGQVGSVAPQDAAAIAQARQQTERELAGERERLRITLASIGDAVISTDVEGRVTFLNGVAEALTGWAEAEAVGRALPEVFRVVHQYTRRPLENPALRALREGVVVGLASRAVLIARDGTERPIDDSAAPIRDESGAPVGAVLVFRDVTERKRAEEALARLAAIVESSADAILSKTLDGVIRTWNAGAQRLFGYAPEEAIGRPIALIIPPDRLAEEQAILEQLLRGERVESLETVRVAKDGRRLDISVTVSPLRDGEGRLIGASKIARDIGERKRAERALRAAEGRHRFLAELAAATQPLVDPDDVMKVASRLLAEHLGADRCAYAEVEGEDIFVITGDHTRGVPSIVGRWPVAAFGPEVVRLMLANEPYVMDDVDADPRAGADLAAYRATSIRAVICVPLHKNGRFTAAMAVHQKAPRHWTPEEVALTRTVVDRCWEALERARVARTLRESEGRYRAIVEATPECVMLVGPDGTLLQMNPAGLRVIEAGEAGDALGQSAYPLIAPEHRAAFQAFNERVCRGEAGTLEFEVIGLRGARRRLETTAVPLPAPGGGCTHLGIARDITERAAAEQALAESRTRLDFAARLSGVGFWYCDLPFDEFRWDERVKEQFWLPPDARVTVDMFYARLHPDDRETTRRLIDASIRDHSQYDIDYRTVDPATGAIKWVRALGGSSYAPDGTPLRFDGVTVDVTDRKRDEERLARALEREREQGRLLRQIADASLAVYSAGSLEHVLRVVAEQARQHLGARVACSSLTEGDDFATTAAVVAPADAGRPPDVGELPREVCRANRPLRLTRAEIEAHPAWHRAGREGGRRPPPGGWLAAPFVGHDGKNLGLLQLCDKASGEFDESDEAALVQLAHIASVAIENARLYAALADQDRRKDEFLALLAHELRNPLAPIRNGLQVLRLSDEPSVRRRSQEMMDRQLGHMVRLVDDLLDVSRISRNKIELRRARVRLADVIGSAVETARPLIDAAGHELEIALPAEPIVVDADLTRLSQVFSNLLTNSAKYTERGGHIRVSAEVAGDTVAVAVQDDGIGIPAAALPAIFDMFSQVDRSIERSRGGLGIGLALVKGLVEMHGGTVTAASAGPGRGSTFTVRLVTSPPAERPAVGAPGLDPHKRPARRVLVVDDHEDSAFTMATMLEILGDEVRMAHDGVEAVEVAEQFRPAVILMDIGMPRLNGYDATRRIREQPWGKAITIIALTGWGQEGDRARSKEAGCAGHLVKPVGLPDLQKLLAELTDPRSLARCSPALPTAVVPTPSS